MELLPIGEFARLSRLSPKALRLYDELGLLRPARTDPVSGYRFYGRDQLARARLVALLRRLDMPLARIHAVCDLPGLAAAAEVSAYWTEVETDLALRRDLARFVIDQLSGEDTAMLDIAVREVPERTLLSAQRHLTVDRLTEFATDLVLRIGDGTVPGICGIEGAPFLIYYGLVDEDNDGPVEFCRAVPTDQADRIVTRFPDLVIRREAAHQEAYVRLTKAESGPVDGLRAFQALERWAADHTAQLTAPRTVYFADPRTAADTTPVIDVAAALVPAPRSS